MTEHRLPPMITPTPGRGFCRWCAGAITTGGRKERNWHDGRDGEPDCKLAFLIATSSAYQRQAVFERDGGKCHDCGSQCEPGLKLDPRCRQNGGWERTVAIYITGAAALAFFRGVVCDFDDRNNHGLLSAAGTTVRSPSSTSTPGNPTTISRCIWSTAPSRATRSSSIGASTTC
jgi:hypothetical protein